MPTRGKGARFCLAISYSGQRYEIRVIKHSAKGVGNRVAKFPAFMNMSRSLHFSLGIIL